MKTVCTSVVALVAAAGLSATFALAQPASKEKSKPAAQPAQTAPAEHQMSPEELAMMEAWQKAATPGEMHERLGKAAGAWEGKVKMWHMPDMPPEESTCTTVMTPMFGGRFLKCETKGQMSMGLFEGFGLYGYDNTVGELQSIWVDNMGTGMMTGTGEVSEDGKTITWTMHFNCPMRNQRITMREVERHINDNEFVLEMYGPDLEGNEYKLMEISYTRAAGHKDGHAAKAKH